MFLIKVKNKKDYNTPNFLRHRRLTKTMIIYHLLTDGHTVFLTVEMSE